MELDLVMEGEYKRTRWMLITQEFIQIYTVLSNTHKYEFKSYVLCSGTAHTVLNSTDAKICAFPLVLVSSLLWITHEAYRNNRHGGIRHIIVLTVGQYLEELFPAEQTRGTFTCLLLLLTQCFFHGTFT